MKQDKEIDCVEDKSRTDNKLFSLHDKVREFEAELIKNALAKSAGNQKKAAQILGIKTTTLHYKIKTYGIKLKLTQANFG